MCFFLCSGPKSLRFEPRSFFTERYSINAGEASIVLLASRTPPKNYFFHRPDPGLLGRIFSSDEKADGKKRSSGDLFARSRALRRFSSGRKKNTPRSMSFLRRRARSRAAGRHHQIRRRARCFYRRDTVCLLFFWLRPKKNNVFPEPQDEFSKSIAFLFGIHFVFRA